MEDIRKSFVSYIDENGKKIDGFYEILEITINFVILSTDKNILKIPIHRVLKIKEARGDL
jgi:uncharacterized protein (UPF0248 family)